MPFKLSLIAILVSSFSVHAQQSDENIERLQVYGQQSSLSSSELLIAEKLEIDEQWLDELQQQTLGATLSNLPGVAGNFFGTSASRPIIRGLGGQRVAIGVNGLPLRDMSSISDDQLLPIEPFFANKITVIKGAAAVVPFGGEAMAGAVDVEDNRIPNLLTDWQPVRKVEVETGFNAATSFMGKVSDRDGDMGFNAALLVRNQGDYDVPDKAKAGACYDWGTLVSDSRLANRCQVELGPPVWEYNGSKWVDATPPEDQVINHLGEDSDGKVNNSGSQTINALVGVSKQLGENQFVGVSFNMMDVERDIPGYIRFGESSNDITIESSVYRFDGQYQYAFSQDFWLRALDVAFNFSKQNDDEYLGRRITNGFELTQWQFKPKLSYALFQQHNGEVALQVERQEHAGSGGDNYLPPVDTDKQGIYWLQNMHWNNWLLQVGARYDQVDYDVSENSDYEPGRGQGAVVEDRSFDLHNYTAALKWQATDNWWLKASYTDAERAPSVNEMYASNPHYALLIEEQGDTKLQTERNEAIEFSSQFILGQLTLAGSWYDNRYSDFIYLGNTGISRGGVSVQEWRQADTDNQGYELSADYHWSLGTMGNLNLTAFIDSVENKPRYHYDGSYDPFDFSNSVEPQPGEEDEYWRRSLEGDSMPRVPADRKGLSARWQYQSLLLSANYVYHDKQELLSKYEQPSESYGLLNLYATWQPDWMSQQGRVFIRMNNVTNQDARPHQSFLRFIAPLPGRSLSVGLSYKL